MRDFDHQSLARRARLGTACLSIAWLALGACGPDEPRSEAELQADLEAFVEARNQCSIDQDCTVVGLSCPLGCGVAVNAQHADAVRQEAEALVEEYESGGTRCDYLCTEFLPPTCVMGGCEAESRSF